MFTAVRFRAVAAAVLVFTAGQARAEPEPAHVLPPSNRVFHALLIGASGLALAGAYAAGAVLTGDDPGARPLAITGGALTGGILGASLGLGLTAMLDDPGSMFTYVLRPVLAGLLGAALGGVLSGLGAWAPGGGRTATHGVIIGLVLAETALFEFARLSKF